jgi:hypothetical protein
MYTDLAHAVEDLESKGISNLSNDEEFGEDIRTGRIPEQIKRMKIIETHRFESGTDPGDESTLYILELPDSSRGYLILSFGMYRDPDKSALIEELRKLESEHGAS